MSAMPLDREIRLAQRKLARPRDPSEGPRAAELLAALGPSESACGWASVTAALLWQTAPCAPDGQTA
jgi:hypothetical protein